MNRLLSSFLAAWRGVACVIGSGGGPGWPRLLRGRLRLASVFGITLAIAVACSLVPGAQAQTTGTAVSTPVVSSTASSGVSGTLALDGKYSNCTVYAQTSTSTATVLANGNTLTAQYGQGSPYTQLGSITATTSQSATQENMASGPVGFFFTWSGNSGTLTAWATCTSANSTTFSGTVTANVPTPLPVTQASVPWNVHDAAVYQPTPLYTAPVHDAAPVQPSPLYTVQVNTAAPLPTYSGVPQVNFGGSAQPISAPATLAVTSPVPNTTAVSPAPGGVLAHGYNAAGGAVPVICTKTATALLTTTQATETLLVASASGKTVYVCSVVMTGASSVAGLSVFGLTSSATNVCGSMSNVLVVSNTTGTTSEVVSVGTGVGLIAFNPVGTALCFENDTVSPNNAAVTIMYEQFLHSLSPDEMDAYCSVPKRCELVKLFKKLYHSLDAVSIP